MPGRNGAFSLDKDAPLALLPYEKMLADTLRGFLSELCFTSAGVVIAYISRRQDENIQDLINSSAELFLKPGLLHYGRNAAVESDWGSPPNVSISMVLREATLTAAFRVVFDDTTIGVHIDRIDFAGGPASPEDNLQRFADALAAARIAAN
ncbi:hypothetical protein AncyloWKF20_12270 [Ancylobacter sp. WKF20]|uniref:hypothetical protein n=1 Tax=Ancylobacter sp. WKF20 TaxID=3039801 RepID=UPI0024343FEC|nr:hypothetical protein [Ancylobacter sp. WKF20]WGD28589.1 hypothetical protein AncyloWKF20_12270 [Ancylobacter sp. WKF20]